MEVLIRLSIFLLIFNIMLFWEWRKPFRGFLQPKLERLSLNLGLMIVNFVVLRIFSAGGAFLVAEFAQQRSIGLFNVLTPPKWLTILLSLLLLDFAIYLQHMVFHKIPVLWRIHRVHHTDLGFDASTAVRFHPLEILLSMYYKMALVLAFGISPWTVIGFEIILNACSLFNHGNVRIPEPWDSRLRWFLITPDMHRIHHSTNRLETDSNYGFSITWWDRICRTYCPAAELGQVRMEIGIPQEREPQRLHFLRLLQLPLEK